MATATTKGPASARTRESVKEGCCRHCGAKLSFLQRFAKQEFCSAEHRDRFLRQQEQLALANLQGESGEASPQEMPAAPGDLSNEAPKSALPAAESPVPEPIDIVVGDDLCPPDALLKSALQQLPAQPVFEAPWPPEPLLEPLPPEPSTEEFADALEQSVDEPLFVDEIFDQRAESSVEAPLSPEGLISLDASISTSFEARTSEDPAEGAFVDDRIGAGPISCSLAIDEPDPLPVMPRIDFSIQVEPPVPEPGCVSVFPPPLSPPASLGWSDPDPCEPTTVALPALRTRTVFDPDEATKSEKTRPHKREARPTAPPPAPMLSETPDPAVEIPSVEPQAAAPPVPAPAQSLTAGLAPVPEFRNLLPIAGPTPVTTVSGFRRQLATFSPAAAMSPADGAMTARKTPVAGPGPGFAPPQLLRLGHFAPARAVESDPRAAGFLTSAVWVAPDPENRLPQRPSALEVAAHPAPESDAPKAFECMLHYSGPQARQPRPAGPPSTATLPNEANPLEAECGLAAVLPAAGSTPYAASASVPCTVALAGRVPIPEMEAQPPAAPQVVNPAEPWEPSIPAATGSLATRVHSPKASAGAPARRGMLRATLPLRDAGGDALLEPFPCPFGNQEDAWQPEL